MSRKLEVFRGADGQWYWHLLNAGQITVRGTKQYRRKWTAKRGARRAYPGVPIVMIA